MRERFDCFDEGCGECEVCKYLNFLEWAEGCAPAGSTIERNEKIEEYLKSKEKHEKSEVSRSVREREEQIVKLVSSRKSLQKKDYGHECYDHMCKYCENSIKDEEIDEIITLITPKPHENKP